MRLLVFLSILTSFSTAALAASSSSGERWMISGFYGLGFVSPSDINNTASAQATTPKLNGITSDTIYGGGLGYMVSPVFQIKGSFELQDAKNPVNTTTPAISGAGYELLQNEIWGSLNYYLAHTGKVYVYVGGSVGYPTYSHVTQTLAAKTEFDADKTIGYRGQLGVGAMLGSHFSLFAEGGYQSLVSGTIKNSSGTALTVPSGANAKMDLSGMRVVGGLGLLF